MRCEMSQRVPAYEFTLAGYVITVGEDAIQNVKSYLKSRSNEEEDRLDKFETAIKNKVCKEFGDNTKPEHVDAWLNNKMRE